MAPKPTRQPVEWRTRPADAPTHRNGTALGRIEFRMAATGEWVPAGFLRYSERDAWSLVFPGQSAPTRWADAQAAMVRFDPQGDGSIPEPEVPEVPEDDSSARSDESTDDDPAATLARSIEDTIRQAMRPTLDIEQVRELIQAELRNMPAPVVRIEYAEREPIELEGAVHSVFDRAFRIVADGRNLYLPGAPGTGKTTLASQIAKAMGVPFRHLSCHPQMTGVSLFGYMDAQGKYVTTDFRECYDASGDGGVFLLDEADNGNGGIIAALNAAIENGSCSFPDGLVKRHPDFRCIVAANTMGTGATAEFAGRNKLDPATLNRFIYLPVGIDEAVEEAMVMAECDPADTKTVQTLTQWLAKVRTCRANEAAANLRPRVFITPRDARDGAYLIARAGFSEREAAESKFLAAVDQTVRERITQGVRFSG